MDENVDEQQVGLWAQAHGCAYVDENVNEQQGYRHDSGLDAAHVWMRKWMNSRRGRKMCKTYFIFIDKKRGESNLQHSKTTKIHT